MARLLPVDQLVGERYEIRAVLEEAPAYRAYRAFDREIEVEVALWHMRDELFPEPAKRRAFVGAVAEMRQVRHANLRRLFDAGEADGLLYVTVQLDTDDGLLPRPGDGQTLDDETLLHYATSVSDALEACHAEGYIHGRLVPPDIVHVAGLIKVGGVGLYRDVDATAARGLWIAHERFVAPEVLSGQTPGPTSDVFSLAALLSELASGASGDDVRGSLGEMPKERAALAEVLRIGTSIDPDRRPTSPNELLEQVAAGLGYEPTAYDGIEAVEPGPDDVGETAAPPPVAHEPMHEIDGLATVDDVPTRQMRKVEQVGLGKAGGKHAGRDFAEPVDVETMVEQPWVARGEPPPPAPDDDPELAAPTIQEGVPVRRREAGQAGSKPVFVSRKPPEERPRPQRRWVPAHERAELKPRVRPISEARQAGPQRDLGRYAPPRAPESQEGERGGSVALWIALAAALLILGGGAAVGLWVWPGWLAGSDGESAGVTADAGLASARRPSAPPRVVKVAADASPPEPCPPEMVIADGEEGDRYCIDRYEAPGKGRMPQSGLSYAEAERLCEAAGKRLCTGDEWEEACRGEGRTSWPYGDAFLRGICNVGGGEDDIAAAGSHDGCQSAAGAFDMSGNVAEWVRGGVVRGGSAADDSDGRCSRVVRRPGRDAAAFFDVGYRCCRSLARGEPNR